MSVISDESTKKLHEYAVASAKRQKIFSHNTWADGFVAGVYYAKNIMPITESCPHCDGLGYFDKSPFGKHGCSKCGGTGNVLA